MLAHISRAKLFLQRKKPLRFCLNMATFCGDMLFPLDLRISDFLLEYGYLLHRQLTFPLGVRPRHEVALRLAFSHMF